MSTNMANRNEDIQLVKREVLASFHLVSGFFFQIVHTYLHSPSHTVREKGSPVNDWNPVGLIQMLGQSCQEMAEGRWGCGESLLLSSLLRTSR